MVDISSTEDAVIGDVEIAASPELQAEVSPDGKTIVFSFVDGTHIAKPSSGHMQKMVLTMQDQNHFFGKVDLCRRG